jgi:hypothetical protein
MRKSLGQRSYGCWRKRMSKDDDMAGTQDYMTHVSDAVSFEAFKRHDENLNLSAETLPESSSMIDFKAFAQEYPDRLFPLLARLRPEFQELFAEYWLLGKSQSFIGKVHGFIQTRVWQNLRIIEQSIGSLILLGTNPEATILHPILIKAGLEDTPHGRLSSMIVLYASTQNYAKVAEMFGVPVPAIRKIFRPAIAALLAMKDVKAVAIGAYLRSLTHQASLTGAGLSKRCLARNRRVKNLRFTAPPSDNSPLMSFGRVESLGETPWAMLEISSDHRMAQIGPTLRTQGKRLFGKKPAQIFAPLNTEGELVFGYLFARSITPAAVRSLTKIRGIGEMAAVCDNDGNFVRAMTVPHSDITDMMKKHIPPTNPSACAQDFVEILTGEAKGYCGTVIRANTITDELTVQVNFPTGRVFVVRADVTSVKKLPKTPATRRMFWGVLGS